MNVAWSSPANLLMSHAGRKGQSSAYLVDNQGLICFHRLRLWGRDEVATLCGESRVCEKRRRDGWNCLGKQSCLSQACSAVPSLFHPDSHIGITATVVVWQVFFNLGTQALKGIDKDNAITIHLIVQETTAANFS